MATHTSILAWRIQWIEESGGLQSIGNLGVYSPSGGKELDRTEATWHAQGSRSGFPGGANGNPAANTGDMGPIPGLGRSPGGGLGNHSRILA